jgi:hypothetical protein
MLILLLRIAFDRHVCWSVSCFDNAIEIANMQANTPSIALVDFQHCDF